MYKNISEIVKEYVLFEGELEFIVKGRVTRRVDGETDMPFTWDISHHYRPSESAATVYYPSARSAKTFKEAESLLFAYMQGFTNIDVTPNEYY